VAAGGRIWRRWSRRNASPNPSPVAICIDKSRYAVMRGYLGHRVCYVQDLSSGLLRMNQRRVDMPEVAAVICKFDAYLSFPPQF
jgi:hypothetical protein